MNSLRISPSPIKNHQKTSLSIQKQSPILKKPNKSKSQINIRKRSHLHNLNQQLQTIKQKIEVSKDILSAIYSKVKKKQSQYEHQISQKELYLHRAKLMITDYKNLYQNELKNMENFVDRTSNLSRNQHHLSRAELQQIKSNALQNFKGKSVQIEHIQFNPQHKQSSNNLSNSKINQSFVPKNVQQVPIQKMTKSRSAVYKQKIKSQFMKVSASKQTKADKQKSTIKKQKSKKYTINLKDQIEDKPNKTSKIAQSKFTQDYKKQTTTDDKKSLYEIYKDRILKRQKQQNSQKMNWIAEKLQQNINDLQLIRKKSQLKLNKYSSSSQNHQLPKNRKAQNAQSVDQNEKSKRLQQKIKRQKSKQRYLDINKNKLKRINEYIQE